MEAMSSGVPILPMGREESTLALCSGVQVEVISVSTGPGQTALTWMPLPPNSVARCLVR